MKIERYSIDKPVQGICKQYGVWIREGASSAPLIYLQKPKWINESQWEEIVNSISLTLPKGYKVNESIRTNK